MGYDDEVLRSFMYGTLRPGFASLDMTGRLFAFTYKTLLPGLLRPRTEQPGRWSHPSCLGICFFTAVQEIFVSTLPLPCRFSEFTFLISMHLPTPFCSPLIHLSESEGVTFLPPLFHLSIRNRPLSNYLSSTFLSPSKVNLSNLQSPFLHLIFTFKGEYEVKKR